MSVRRSHIIRKPILEVKFPAHLDREEMNTRLSDIFWNQLLPVIEEISNSLSPQGVLHRIDHLEIDLGTIPVQGFEKASLDAFRLAFAKELGTEIRKLEYNRERNINQQEGKSQFTEKELFGKNEKNPDADFSIVQAKKDLGQKAELLAYFLETGLLPWWADYTKPAALLEALDSWAQKKTAFQRTQLGKWLAHLPIKKRLITQFPDSRLWKLAEVYVSDIKSIRQTYEALGALNPKSRFDWWSQCFYYLREHDGQPDKALTFIRRISVSHSAEHPPASTESVEGPPVPPDIEQLRKLSARMIRKAMEQGQLSGPDQQPEVHEKENQINPRLDENLSEKMRGETKNTKQALPPLQNYSHITHFSQTKEIYILNSGLIILWPFFNRFLSQLNLVKDKQFVSLNARHRSAYILQGIATGQPENPEYLLPLNKILCGIPVAAAPEPMEPLSDEELNDGQLLLQAVIGQIPILNNMSVDGFRGSFLLREGVLKANADHWQLNVNRETFDVVLDRFPWPINFVKLPWMDRMIYVEW